MQRSTNRILTTHVGSLPRPPDLVEMMAVKHQGGSIDQPKFAASVTQAVADIVRRQAEIGIDIVADGEMSKVGFIPYINDRLDGFQPGPLDTGGSYWGQSRDARAFPEYYDWVARQPGTAGGTSATRWVCCGPIAYKGQRDFQADVANLQAAMAGQNVIEAFMPAVSPANIEDWDRNAFYKTDEEYLHAVAEALRQEYLAIVDAGLILQIDDPALATRWIMHPDASVAEVRRWAEIRVEALNHALRGIPEDKIRYHTCYSINMGPRVGDMELRHIIDIILRVNAGAYSFEAANPRHEHEWHEWEKIKLPEGKILIPGVITHSTTLVEHPELVAERLVRFANVVGRENVIAGADCGFASFAVSHEMHASIVWAKLSALVEGARIASARLWGRAAAA